MPRFGMVAERTPEPVIIHTARLTLRPFAPGDVDDVWAYVSEPEWRRYLIGLPEPYTREDADLFVASRLLDDWSSPHWAVEHNGRVIGAVNLAVDETQGRAALGYGIARTHQGQGLATEAARAAVVFTFDTLGLPRLFATTDARNAASQRVLAKLGFVYEGVLRGNRLTAAGEHADEAVFGMVKSER